MARVRADLRFAEIEYELWALGEYLDALEVQIKFITDQKRVQTHADLQVQRLHGDGSEAGLVLQELSELMENVLRRFFRGPFLVTLWAVYEAAITQIAAHLQREQDQALALKDIRGHTFLERANKYFGHVVAVPLHLSESIGAKLEMLLVLRNAVAHGNGRLGAVSKEAQKKIKYWSQQDSGISEINGFLLLSDEFLRNSYQLVAESLRDLIRRIRELPRGPSA
jgi:hypothetical protein